MKSCGAVAAAGGADAGTGFSFDIGRRSRAVAETVKFTLSAVPGAGSRPARPCYAVRRGLACSHAHRHRAENLFDAHLVKDALAAAEIPAHIAGEYLTGGVGQLPAMDYIAVMVPDSSLPRAQDIVREVEAALSEARLAIQDIDDLPDDPLVMPC